MNITREATIFCQIVWIVALLVFVLVVPLPALSAQPVSPTTHSVWLFSGKEDHLIIRATPPPIVIDEKIDLFFLVDCTGSMGEIERTMKRYAVHIVETLSKTIPAIAFGVSFIRDYDWGNPWELLQDITEDRPSIIHALGRISLIGGADAPEAYVLGLSELSTLTWRSGARRMVIFFADAPAHDPDPGRDAVLGTADDLTLDAVVRRLAVENIAIYPIYVYGGATQRDQLEFMAQRTKGATRPLGSPEDMIQVLMETVISEFIEKPAIQKPKDYVSWVAIHDPLLVGTDHFEFPVTIHPPYMASIGRHEIPLTVIYPGGSPHPLGHTILAVHIIPIWILWVASLAILAYSLSGLARRFFHPIPFPVRFEKNSQWLVAFGKLLKLSFLIALGVFWMTW